MKSSRNQRTTGKKASSPKSKKKSRKVRTPIKIIMQRKLAFTFCVIMLALFVLIGVAGIKASSSKDEYSRKVLAQMGYDSQTIPYQRGNITDRNGIVLATNEVNYNLILDPSIITSNETTIAEPTIRALVQVFGEMEEFTEEKLRSQIYADPDATYIRYKKGLTEADREAFVAYQEQVNNNLEITDWIKGVWFETEYKRIYPYGRTACDLIGFSTQGGSVGNYGIEQYYNDELIGTNGRIYGYLNQDSLTEVNVIQAVDGNTVVSTIDYKLQKVIEDDVREFWNTTGAENIAVIAMDPNSGEILAGVNLPDFDLNDTSPVDLEYDVNALLTETELAEMSEKDADELAYSRALDNLWKNYITTTTYEPGSTMKPFTVAAALEEGKVTENSQFICNGVENVDGVDIQCAVYPNSHGTENLQRALVNSCNPALIQISYALGTDLLSRYQNFWGFGSKTGVDLPYEEAGLLIDSSVMSKVDAATNSFGQNMNVTIIQMASAFCSLINGGTYYQPHVVKQILNAEGQVVQTIEPEVVRETISRSTGEFIKEALRLVLAESRYWEDIEGYVVGGKTGTAEKYPRGNGKYVLSLASFEPYDDPELFIMVVVDEPNVPDQSTGGYTTMLANKIWRHVIEYRYGVNLGGEEDPEENPEGTGGTPENPDNPEETPENPEENPDNPEETPENPEGNPGDPGETPENPGDPGEIPGNPDDPGGTPENPGEPAETP